MIEEIKAVVVENVEFEYREISVLITLLPILAKKAQISFQKTNVVKNINKKITLKKDNQLALLWKNDAGTGEKKALNTEACQDFQHLLAFLLHQDSTAQNKKNDFQKNILIQLEG